ncbi:hypothetical protein [Mumia zhuanghuii]|uniref:Uncharacterized protein n=1 Tax=Mumia zhuanghuii TaxID=2585211 RepID=A0A5C4MCG1_9ACTN|nr:hypothetical protein [Mumia zhuanghuii]TNC36077.1 hypothetical protein FHE65_26445 [Mumia zhuanghuii]TNC41629.1 hypothetical protein FHE65_22405 [Mumia zhuanghuii]
MTAPTGGDDVGTLAHEAMKLARVLAQQAREGRVAADAAEAGADPASDPADAASHEHRPEVCDHCPLCQLLSLVRDARPEVAEHLTAALTSLTLAARGVVESWASPRAGEGGGQRADGPVENIDVEDGPWE